MIDSAPNEDCVLVIGSGPSAVAVCSVLLDRGARVTMVDAGVKPSSQFLALQSRLGAVRPEEWQDRDVAEWRYKPSTDSTIGLKSWFGSLHAYEVPETVKVNSGSTGFRASHALGGFSSVWGGTLLPYSDRELYGFPLETVDLENHYRAILRLLPYSATADSLADRYPLYSDAGQPLHPSVGALTLLDRLAGRREALKRHGIEFGRSRLAVRAATGGVHEGCTYCGRCLDGCPYSHIWSSVSTVQSFADHPNFRYVGGFVVDVIRETADSVYAEGRDQGGVPHRLIGTRAMIAAGTVGSARILLKSGLVGDQLVVRDSQTVFAPFVWFGPRQPPDNRSATLSEVFISLDDPSVSPHPIQLQVYPSNDSLIGRAQAEMPLLAPLFKKMGRAFDQIMPVVIYLHSEDSGSALIRDHNDVLTIEEIPNPRRERVLAKLWKRLIPQLIRVGLVGVPRLAVAASVGEGFHTGASIPMSLVPRPGTSDLLGRPFGCRRIHVVDASILSHVPAGPITLSVMANAHRIAVHLPHAEDV